MNSRLLRSSPVFSSRLPSVSTRKWFPLAARFTWAAYVRGPTDLKYCWNRMTGSGLGPAGLRERRGAAAEARAATMTGSFPESEWGAENVGRPTPHSRLPTLHSSVVRTDDADHDAL